MQNSFKIAFIGDIVGAPGRKAFKEGIKFIKKEHSPLFVVANGENSANGFGITHKVYDELISSDIDVITMGNHTWDKKEAEQWIDSESQIIRPANFSPYAPGKGYHFVEKNGVKICVVNLIGRVFMDNFESPFLLSECILPKIREYTNFILVDFHAEASSEKKALAYFLNGKVSAVFGTHTHVQTADEDILNKGTAYITDVGMTGAYNSIIGNKISDVMDRFVKGFPRKLEVATDDLRTAYVVVEIDKDTGSALSIYRNIIKIPGD